ncbi:hypothetical protein, partial [Mycobacterium sp. KBS0706]|uniref:hypothetical protein n=1 Tax=Mycobacterium sp. KBS0706 TaxID=2578109 RepID=UPI001C8F4CC6
MHSKKHPFRKKAVEVARVANVAAAPVRRVKAARLSKLTTWIAVSIAAAIALGGGLASQFLVGGWVTSRS